MHFTLFLFLPSFFILPSYTPHHTLLTIFPLNMPPLHAAHPIHATPPHHYPSNTVTGGGEGTGGRKAGLTVKHMLFKKPQAGRVEGRQGGRAGRWAGHGNVSLFFSVSSLLWFLIWFHLIISCLISSLSHYTSHIWSGWDRHSNERSACSCITHAFFLTHTTPGQQR